MSSTPNAPPSAVSRPNPAIKQQAEILFDIEEEYVRDFLDCRDFTMVSVLTAYNLQKSVDYVIDAGIPGAIVECGVWRGGCMMMAAKRLLRRSALRDIWLFDTFAGMTEPGDEDAKTYLGEDNRPVTVSARTMWTERYGASGKEWCFADRSDVEANLRSTGYPMNHVRMVEGDVAETLTGDIPDEIAILRLDTDWYASSKVELEVLYPRLKAGGVLILDDYGGWHGQRQATDEFFSKTSPILLHRVDRGCRAGIKSVG